MALVADDDPGQRLLMEHALARAGLGVVTVENGAEAVTAARNQRFDLICLDVVMPDMTGLDACREIRSRLAARCPPIIMVTSQESDDAIAEAFAAGATDYVIKPVNWSLLRHRVRGWLAAHQAAQAPATATGRGARTLVVSRRAEVLADSETPGVATEEGPVLDSVLAPALAAQVITVARKVLKSREPARLSFGGTDVEISVAGRDKVQVTLAPAQGPHAAAQELFRLAYLDSVTGLPNRHLFERTATAALDRARLQGGGLLLLCAIFDPLPTLRPDTVELQQVARALADQLVMRLRDSDHLVRFDNPDAAGSPVANADSMHFLVLLENVESPETLRAVEERIRAASSAVAASLDGRLSLTPRVGVARCPEDAATLPELIGQAMQAANEARRGNTVRHGRGHSSSVESRADLAAELRHGLSAGQFLLYYQPRLDIGSGQVCGAEALLRWQHPLRGLLTGELLFAMADEAGEAVRLADWALDAAIRQAAAWGSGLPIRLRVAINTNAPQLARPDFSSRLIAQAAGQGLDPATLEIEVGERCLDSGEAAVAQLVSLSDAGIGLVVDDFNAGAVSLGTLRRLRINGFKIARERLCASSPSADATGLFALAGPIARARHAVLIAKGIESAAELAQARVRGCDQAQGFYLCQPLPVAEFEHYLARTREATAVAI